MRRVTPLSTRERVLSGAEAIVVERWRQITVEGWGSEHDAQLDQGELIAGAVAYALNAWGQIDPARWWPFNPDRFKPADPSVAGRIRDLVKAGAMIASEIDRLADLALADAEQAVIGDARSTEQRHAMAGDGFEQCPCSTCVLVRRLREVSP